MFARNVGTAELQFQGICALAQHVSVEVQPMRHKPGRVFVLNATGLHLYFTDNPGSFRAQVDADQQSCESEFDCSPAAEWERILVSDP